MKINSIRAYIEILKKIDVDKGYSIFFRGHSKEKDYKLIPSIYRQDKTGFLENEDIIYREIQSYLPDEFINERTSFDSLVKMQHYLIPTRLLDITKNPLVALYFAAKKNFGVRGEVIVFKVPVANIRHYDSDSVTVIANLVKRPSSFDISQYDEDTESFNKQDEIQYLLHEIRSEKPHFSPIIQKDTLNSVQCVNPKMNNQRILRQEGAFFLFGIDGMKKYPANIESNWLLFNNSDKLFIHQKKKILEELNLFGINERFLFPELENQYKYLNDKYNTFENKLKTT